MLQQQQQQQPRHQQQLSCKWETVLSNLRTPPFRTSDVVALWHHAAQMLNLPNVDVVELKNLSQQQTLNTLDRAKDSLYKVLRGQLPQSEENRRKTLVY